MTSVDRAVLVGIGLLALCSGLFFIVTITQMWFEGRRRVVGSAVITSVRKAQRMGGGGSYPVHEVEYRLADGAATGAGVVDHECHVGDELRIRYDPDHPDRNRPDKNYPGVPYLAFIIGIGLFVAGTGVVAILDGIG